MKRKILTIVCLAVLICSTAGFYKNCGGQSSNQATTQQPKTVADLLTNIGNTKRQAKTQGLISAQQDKEITTALLKANEAYAAYIVSEQARLITNPAQAPDSGKIAALKIALVFLEEPGNFGITNQTVLALWKGFVPEIEQLVGGQK